MGSSKTIRILSLDGGGIRGYISATFLQQFVQLWGINPAEIWKYFDVITGTSIGGIQALAYAYGLTPAQMQQLFIDNGASIFDCALGGRAGWVTKGIVMTAGWPLSTFYPNTGLISTINSVLPTQTLQDMKTNVMITSYNQDADVPVFFSNVTMPGFIGQNELAANIALATASAPLYFPTAVFAPPSVYAGINFIDGGVQQNNPAEIALTLGQMLNPTANRFCVLSVGTGLGEIGTPETITQAQKHAELEKLKIVYPEHARHIEHMKGQPNILDNMQLLLKLIDVGITGCQEAVNSNLKLQSLYTLQNVYYYRFNYSLDSTRDIELDNFDPSFFSYMQQSASEQFEADMSNITNFLGHLTA